MYIGVSYPNSSRIQPVDEVSHVYSTTETPYAAIASWQILHGLHILGFPSASYRSTVILYGCLAWLRNNACTSECSLSAHGLPANFAKWDCIVWLLEYEFVPTPRTRPRLSYTLARIEYRRLLIILRDVCVTQ